MRGVAHNINTPLATIMGRSEMVKLRCQQLMERDESKADGLSDDINKSLKDITLIIQNTEKITAIIKNVMNKCVHELLYQVQEINLSMLLTEELRFLESDMEFKHKIEKTYNLNGIVPSIYGIYSHFSHSFLQILDNCKKAMDKAEIKKLTVTLAYHNKCITVMFHDTGCGFEPGKREDIVQFLNNNGSDDSRIDGLAGGGMYHVKMLLKKYNPTYDIASCPGDTKFVIQFPVR
jgi:signal transduction histidine kinase